MLAHLHKYICSACVKMSKPDTKIVYFMVYPAGHVRKIPKCYCITYLLIENYYAEYMTYTEFLSPLLVIHTLLQSFQLSKMPVCLPHFLHSECGERVKSGSLGVGSGSRDCTGFVAVGNLSFSSLSACHAVPCTFNNAFPVPTTAVIGVSLLFFMG